jgi:hypothetical protein
LFSQNGIKRKTIANKNGKLWQLIYHRMSYLPIVSKLDFKHQKVTKSIRVCTVLLKCIDQGFILAIEKHSFEFLKSNFVPYRNCKETTDLLFSNSEMNLSIEKLHNSSQ